jgi:hypothetical protein
LLCTYRDNNAIPSTGSRFTYNWSIPMGQQSNFQNGSPSEPLPLQPSAPEQQDEGDQPTVPELVNKLGDKIDTLLDEVKQLTQELQEPE